MAVTYICDVCKKETKNVVYVSLLANLDKRGFLGIFVRKVGIQRLNS